MTEAEQPAPNEPVVIDPIVKLTADVKAAAKLLGRQEARFIVDSYYQRQNNRKRADNQVRAMKVSGEPTRVIAWESENQRRCEENLKKILGIFAEEYTVGRWMLDIVGIGPIISAGMLAEFNIVKAKTFGHFWSYAGLSPAMQWVKKDDVRDIVNEVSADKSFITEAEIELACVRLGRSSAFVFSELRKDPDYIEETEFLKTDVVPILAKRPYNADLKTLAVYALGECMVKFQNNKADFYGKLFRDHRDKEEEMNKAGKFAAHANWILTGVCYLCGTRRPDPKCHLCHGQSKVKPKTYRKSTEAYKAYVAGLLPPAHLHARARRHAVKLFLAHLHHVMFEDYHGIKPPDPYVFVKGEGDHRHYIDVPNWPMAAALKGKSLKEMTA